MTTTVHKNLTGSDLHEPKGADTALVNTVYVANGSGSGVWTTASSIITNTAFSTGDTKFTYKSTADTSWIMMDDGTIGDGSSGATTRGNADTAALYTLFWTECSNTDCPVSGGRGVSAAADFAAHKALGLPKVLGRKPVIAGAGSGLTARTLGHAVGADSVVLVTGNLPPYTPAGTIALNADGSSPNAIAPGYLAVNGLTGSSFAVAPTSQYFVITGTFTGTPQGGVSTAVNIVNAEAAMNVMVKL